MPDNTSLIPAEASVGYLAALDGIADGSSINGRVDAVLQVSKIFYLRIGLYICHRP
jgi:hypothetical protein